MRCLGPNTFGNLQSNTRLPQCSSPSTVGQYLSQEKRKSGEDQKHLETFDSSLAEFALNSLVLERFDIFDQAA